MTLKEQKKLIDDFILKQKDLLLRKGDDYSDGNDRLSNFKKVAELTNLTPEKIVLTHITNKVVRISDNLGQKTNFESVEDSVVDLANYAILLMCVLEDKKIKKIEIQDMPIDY